MAIEIKYQELGDDYIIVKEIKALTRMQLPEDYVQIKKKKGEFVYLKSNTTVKLPWMPFALLYINNDSQIFKGVKLPDIILEYNGVYDKNLFKKKIDIIKRCGENLREFKLSKSKLKKIII